MALDRKSSVFAFLLAVCVLVPVANSRMGNSGDADAHLRKAAGLMDRGRLRDGRAEITAALKANPSDPATYLTALAIWTANERWRDALAVGEALLDRHESRRLKPALAKVEIIALYQGLGTAYWKTRDLESAAKAFEAALALSPNDPMALNDLGYFYADEGIKLRRALALTRKAALLRPHDGMVIDSLGWAQYRLKDHKEAVKTLRRAVELAPDSADLRYHLGAAYAAMGSRAAARVELEKSLLLDPHQSQAAKLLKTLQK